MKKLISMLIAVILISSCKNDETIESIPPSSIETTNSLLRYRTLDEAKSIAIGMANSKYAKSRSFAPQIKNVKVIYNTQRSRSTDAETLLYAVNYENNEGFALIAAPINVEPVIALTESGEFGSEETESNENFQYVLQSAKEFVNNQASLTISPDTFKLCTPDYSDTTYYSSKIEKRINVLYNQYWPEGVYCPNKIAGCVPVAIAQICSYFKSPEIVSLNYSNKDQSICNLNWADDLLGHQNSLSIKDPSLSYTTLHLKNCNASTDQHYELGRFIRQIGEYAKADYSKPDKTSVTTSNAVNTIRHFLSSKKFSRLATPISVFNNIYTSSGVAMMIGVTPDSIGHCWIADGAMQLGYTVNTYSYTHLPSDYNSNEDLEVTEYGVLVSTESEYSSYIHFNWGWGGNCNGYFIYSVLNPAKGYEYDSILHNQPSESYTKHNYFLLVE